MSKHLNQARHNERFHVGIKEIHPDRYFDWKVTCLFYTANHYIKALAEKRGIDIGNTHRDISINISYRSPNVRMNIGRAPYQNYSNLLSYSRTARYDGFENYDDFEALRKADYRHSIECLRQLKLYVKGQGVEI